jgi:metal-responsive CopG/Arc/MetJ family transcriptional regulator
MPQVYFNLPGDDLEAVDYLAEREGVSRSEVLREAVAEYLHGRADMERTS